MEFIRGILSATVDGLEGKPLGGLIEDTHVKIVAWRVKGKGREQFTMAFTYRRMGIDNGMDTYVHLERHFI